MSTLTASSSHERVSLFREAPMVGDLSEERAERSADRNHRFNYKPVILRTIPLLGLFLLSLLFIGLLQFAVVQLPHGENRLGILDSRSQKRELHVYPRQDGSQSLDTQASSTAAQDTAPGASATASDSSSTYEQATSSIATSNYLNPDRTTSVVEATTQESAYVSPTETLPSSTATSNYVDPDRTTAVTIETLTSAESAYISTKETYTAVASAAESGYLGTGETTISPPPPPAYSTAPSDYVKTKDTVVVKPTAVTNTFVVVSTSQSAVVLPVTPTHTAEGTSTTEQTAYLTTGGTLMTAADLSTAYVPVAVTVTVTSTSQGLQTTRPTSTSGLSGADGDSVSHGKSTIVVIGWDNGQIFLSTYLAVLLAVLYRLLFSVLHNQLTLIEPFRQLSEPQGALAEKALFSFYHNQSGLLGPIPALRSGRWALAWVGTAYLAACLLPALASEAIWVDTKWQCPDYLFEAGNKNNPCPARMTASVPVIRALQGLLAFAAVIILGLASLLLLRRTGLPADPSSIATVASIMRHPALLEDLNEMPTGASASHENLKASMNGKRYYLGAWDGPNGRSYGIRPVTDVDSEAFSERSPSMYSKESTGYAPVDSRSSFNEADIIAHRWRWMDFALLVCVSGAFGVVLAYYLDGNDDGFNRFFSSNSFGPRFILTGAGTLIANMWNVVEESSLVMTPFNRLAKGPASARGTLAFAPSNTPIVSTWRTLRNGYWIAAVVSVTTLLGEALNIVISGVPYANAQTWQQFLISAYLSIAILSIMILVCAGVIYHRKHEPRIPVHPDTLGAKMSYLAGARFLDDFQGAEWEKSNVRDERLRLLRKKYGFRPTVRKDGRRTWLVDEAHDNRGSYQSI